MVYKLCVISNPLFKVSFNLWNERGMNHANSFIEASKGSQHPWVHVLSKSTKRSYVEVAHNSPNLSGANQVPLDASKSYVKRTNPPRVSVFSRLNSNDLCRNLSSIDQNLVMAKNTDPALNAAKSKGSDNSGEFLNLNLNLSLRPQNPEPMSLNSSPMLPVMGRKFCSRCLSHKHLRPMCGIRVRCCSCFRLGHISIHCRFPPRFPGLDISKDPPTFLAITGDFFPLWHLVPLTPETDKWTPFSWSPLFPIF